MTEQNKQKLRDVLENLIAKVDSGEQSVCEMTVYDLGEEANACAYFNKKWEAEQAKSLEQYPLMNKYPLIYEYILQLMNIQNELVLKATLQALEIEVNEGLENKSILEVDSDQIAKDIQTTLERHPLISEVQNVPV